MLIDEKEDGLENFWSLEKIGISDVTKENENEKILLDFEKSLTKVDCRYQVKWP